MSEISVTLSLFVEHGREKAAADFYATAFGVQKVQDHTHAGQLIAVDLLAKDVSLAPTSVSGFQGSSEGATSTG